MVKIRVSLGVRGKNDLIVVRIPDITDVGETFVLKVSFISQPCGNRHIRCDLPCVFSVASQDWVESLTECSQRVIQLARRSQTKGDSRQIRFRNRD